MSFAIRNLRCEQGQATIEAAFALPVLMLLMLLLLQPGFILYDRIVMCGAAAEGCRLLATSPSGSSNICDDYIRRRLSAIPEVDIFHVHKSGCTWDITLTGNEMADSVKVSIATEVKPMPFLDIGASLLGLTNSQGNLVVKVESEMQTQPDWVRSSTSGQAPSDWIKSWL